MWPLSTLVTLAALSFANAQLDDDVAASSAPPNLNNAASAPYYPSPWMHGDNDWAVAYARAQAFVSKLTLLEKVNLTTGVGWEGEVSNKRSIPFIVGIA